MRIAATLGVLAICAAVVLFFLKYWGFLDVPVQVAILMLTPLAALTGAEYAARRERTLYFAGLIALVALASFIMNLTVLGRIFNVIPTETALLAWGVFAVLLAYRYGLRPHLAIGLALLLNYGAAFSTPHVQPAALDAELVADGAIGHDSPAAREGGKLLNQSPTPLLGRFIQQVMEGAFRPSSCVTE